MRRILVVGLTGSGKTTLARALADLLDLRHVELDALHWEPNWVQAETEVFRERVRAATEGDGWVVCGNYFSKLGDLLWTRADTVLWLDIPLPLVLARIVRRTVRRSLRKVELWSGNVERLSGLWSKGSLLAWAVTSRKRIRRRYQRAPLDTRWAHIRFIRFRSLREVRRWLAELEATHPRPTDG